VPPAVWRRSAQAANRTPGKYYLVIQDMGGMTAALKAEAEAIVAYLEPLGFRASVEADKAGRQWRVCASDPDGFGSPGSEKARLYAAVIKAKAQGYRDSPGGKRYSFSERGSDGRPRFVKYERPAGSR